MSICLTELPITVTSSRGTRITEKFSTKYQTSLSSLLLKNLGLAFQTTQGKSQSCIDRTAMAIERLCKFLVAHGHQNEVKSLKDITSEIFITHIDWLKVQPTRTSASSKTPNGWYFKWMALQSAIRTLVSDDTLPYVPTPAMNHIEGHTALAMKMILQGCQKEINRIRCKLVTNANGSTITKWQDYANRGRVLSLEWFDTLSRGKRSSLTKKQLDELEYQWFEISPNSPDYNDIKKNAERLNVKTNTIVKIKKAWEKAGREDGRPRACDVTEDCDLKQEDVVATIYYYLPQWPVIGRLGVENQHRVYESMGGKLIGTYLTQSEANSAAADIGGIAISDLKFYGDPRMNPAEKLLSSFTRNADRHLPSPLHKKLRNLFLGGIKGLIDELLPTKNDLSVIYIYWICLSGWNRESVTSVTRFQLARLVGKLDLHPLSKDHVTLSAEIMPLENNLVGLTGEKWRSQNNKPKICTITCSINEKYGLFRVLADYFYLTQPLSKILADQKMGGDNCILLGFNNNRNPVAALGVDGWTTINEKASRWFFKEHEVYLEVNGERLWGTNAQKLRKTWFTTLQHMGIPLTTQMFLGRHEDLSTTLLSYAGDATSTAIIESKLRNILTTLADKAFKGQLKHYDQHNSSKIKDAVVQVFAHRDNAYMACMNCLEPSWEGNKDRLARTDTGKLKAPCNEWRQCIFCTQCIITKESLPFLLQWRKDIHYWADKAGWIDFPVFYQKFLDAVEEIFDRCEAEWSFWRKALRDAEAKIMEDDFTAPILWGDI